MSNNRKDMMRVLNDAAKRGWRVWRARSGHYKMQWVDGTVRSAAYSSSCHRAVKNVEHDLLKVENKNA